MSIASGSSLWIMPDPLSPSYIDLAEANRMLAKRFNTSEFAPHVTLMGGLGSPTGEMLVQLREFSRQIAPFEVMLDQLGSNQIFFQMIFSAVIPSSALTKANQTAHEIFKIPQATYFAHLSHLYGLLTPEEVNEGMDIIRKDFPRLKSIKFRASHIALWHTNGKTSEWRQFSTRPLIG